MSAAVTIAEKLLSVAPGGEIGTDVTVRNDGSVVDEFTIEVLGEPGAYATIEPPVIRLFPGSEQSVRVTFRPPRDHTTAGGAQPFGVRATPKEDPAGLATDEGVLSVEHFADVVAELVPRTVRGRRSARTELAIDDRGNQPLDLVVEGADPEGSVQVEVDPPRITMDPGTATFLKVKVQPSRSFWRGPPKTHPFQVAISREGEAPLIVDGSMVQDPLVPKWFWKALLLLLALLLLALLLWHFLLKPKIEAEARTAAQAAAAKEVAEAVKAAEAAGGGSPAGGSSGGPAGGEEATTTTVAPTTTTTTAPAKAPTPTDFRLVANTSKTRTVQRDFGSTKQKFSLTDIVLQNPAGDSGTLTILRGSDVVLVLNLDNFRDLDYHYVAPIVFDKVPLSMRVDCTRGGSANGGPPAAECTPAASISGYVEGP